MTWLLLIAFVLSYAATAAVLKIRRHQALNRLRAELDLPTKPLTLRRIKV